MAALLMCAHKLKFLTDNQHSYLWTQISSRGYRLREPPELDFTPEVPEVLNEIIGLHLGALGYSPPELAMLVCVHVSELKTLYVVGDDGKSGRKAKLRC